jgi:hypothetical protein
MAFRDRIYVAVLCSAAGDAIGFHNSFWEFNTSMADIHKQLYKKFGGLSGMCIFTNLFSIILSSSRAARMDLYLVFFTGFTVNTEQFRLSDDTDMSIATAEALLAAAPINPEVPHRIRTDTDTFFSFFSQTTFADSSFPVDLDRLMKSMANHYVACIKDMKGRGMNTHLSERLSRQI